MRLILNNICKVSSANIKLNGLTIIAGENGSGKSSVGRTLFSTIKALSDTKIADNRAWTRNITKQVASLYQRLQGSFYRHEDKNRDLLFPLPYRKFISNLLAENESNTLNEHYQTLVNSIESLNATPRIKALMKRDLDNIIVNIKNKDNRAAAIKTSVEYSIESEFMNSICSFGKDSSFIDLSMDDGEKTGLNIYIRNDEVNKVVLGKSEFPIDATYVESPLYIHMIDTLMNAATFREGGENLFRRSMLPIHIKDLAEKIDSLRFSNPTLDFFSHLDIRKTIGGSFRFDENKRILVFEQDDHSISPINVASGVKSFGLVQMMLETNTINADKVLIWDEPENHLHPQWQIAFANLMVQLSKNGIPILVSTHSPYFVQGVRFFAAQHDIEPFVNYYLAEIEHNGLSNIHEVTDDLNTIFVRLSQPLNEVMNVDLTRRMKL